MRGCLLPLLLGSRPSPVSADTQTGPVQRARLSGLALPERRHSLAQGTIRAMKGCRHLAYQSETTNLQGHREVRAPGDKRRSSTAASAAQRSSSAWEPKQPYQQAVACCCLAAPI